MTFFYFIITGKKKYKNPELLSHRPHNIRSKTAGWMVIGLLLTGWTYARGQTANDYQNALRNNSITLHTDAGHKLRFDVKESNKRPSLDKTYHWYTSRHIHTSQGDYSGKVLHGEYNEYYRSNDLASKGRFKHGLKTGKWSSWNESGKMTAQSHWKKGDETGSYIRFDEEGYLLERGRLIQGRRDGKIFIYTPQDSGYSHTYFDQGIETTEKDYYGKQNIWKRSSYYLGRQWARLFGKKED